MRLSRAATAVLAGALGLGPFQRNDPRVSDGMSAYDKGDYEAALHAFEAAEKDHPKSAALAFDRGNALYKLKRFDEAKEAYHHVAELDSGEFKAKDFYNLGSAWAGMGNDKEAIAALRKSLTLDPSDAQARHNLEVLLRKVPPPKQNAPDGGMDGGSDGGQPDAGHSDGGRDGGADGGGSQDGGGGDGGQSDGGAGDGGQGDGGQGKGQGSKGRSDGGGAQDAGESEPQQPERSRQDAGAAEADKVSREEAQRLLDSMKNDEKSLQLWRFQQRKPKKQTDKDW